MIVPPSAWATASQSGNKNRNNKEHLLLRHVPLRLLILVLPGRFAVRRLTVTDYSLDIGEEVL
jgi:hypothetical protein